MAKPQIKIHQFHYSISDGDAISNQMFLIQSALAEKGIGGDIFASVRSGSTPERSKEFSSAEIENGSWLLIHHSQGNPRLDKILELHIKKALVYHNVTPQEYFTHDNLLKRLCALGREQLPHFRGEIEHSFADSLYNASELSFLGMKTDLLPLLDLKPTVNRSNEATPPLRGLFVGRITPHKNQARLIETVHQLKHLGFPVKLVLVGGSDPIYQSYLNRLARHLAVDLEIIGKVSDAELEMQYQKADFFICLSLHEGFCIPLVEAMRYQIPIFALKKTAVGETLGTAAIQFETDDPFDVACTIKTVLENPHWKTKVLESQKQRYEALRQFQNKTQITDQLVEALCKDL